MRGLNWGGEALATTFTDTIYTSRSTLGLAHCGTLSHNSVTTKQCVTTSRSTVGLAWKSIQFPDFPPNASVTLQLETLKPFQPELPIGKNSLIGNFLHALQTVCCLLCPQCLQQYFREQPCFRKKAPLQVLASPCILKQN